jgi:hypothetical protein
VEWQVPFSWEFGLNSLKLPGVNGLLGLDMHFDVFESDFQAGQWVPVFLLLLQTACFKLNSSPDYLYRGIVLSSRDRNRGSRLGVFDFSWSRKSTRLFDETENTFARRLKMTSKLFDDCEP